MGQVLTLDLHHTLSLWASIKHMRSQQLPLSLNCHQAFLFHMAKPRSKCSPQLLPNELCVTESFKVDFCYHLKQRNLKTVVTKYVSVDLQLSSYCFPPWIQTGINNSSDRCGQILFCGSHILKNILFNDRAIKQILKLNKCEAAYTLMLFHQTTALLIS